METVLTLVRIGSTTIKNRLVFPSMCMFYSDDAGSVTPRIADFLQARAMGGVGLFIQPGTPYGNPSRGRPAISADWYIVQWKRLKAVAESYGMSLFCQLHPSKIQAGRGEGTQKPEDYSRGEISAIIRAYAEGALRARQAGLDGVEIHAAHAHEVAQFLSPFYNRRTDDYGGDLNGRSRFGREIIESIKNLAGKDFPVIFRFGVEECIPGGRELAESIELACLLERTGADALHMDLGTPQSDHLICPPMDLEPGFSVPRIAEVKKAVRIPIIAAGRINDIALAEKIIRSGQADMVAMGRALLADPNLPAKWQEGRFDDIRRCIACNQGCRAQVAQKKEVYCLQNPRTGREATFHVRRCPPDERKDVVVVGAGPAGLEAACVLAGRGHRVSVYEQKHEAGGAFLLASKPPHKEIVYEVIRFRLDRLKKFGVKVIFDFKVDSNTIEQLKPDAVFIATGSVSASPTFPVFGAGLYTPDQVLAGKLPAGNRVVIIGGGIIGCEVADFLAAHEYSVDIVEQQSSLAPAYNKARRYYLMERLTERKIRIILNAAVKEVKLTNVTIFTEGREETLVGYDSIIYAGGRKSNNELAHALDALSLPMRICTVGDALMPRNALIAIHESALKAAEI